MLLRTLGIHGIHGSNRSLEGDDYFEVIKTSEEEMTADTVEVPRELELEAEPEEVTELL